MRRYLKPKIAFTCLLICFVAGAYSQNKRPSSPASPNVHKADTLLVNSLVDKSKRIQSSRPDSALIYAQRALNLARNIHYKIGEATSLNRLGVVLWQNGKYDLALQFLLNSLKIREENKDRLGELANLNNIGIIYSDQNDDKKALSYHFQAKQIAESIQNTAKTAVEVTRNKKWLSIVLANIGNSYRRLNKIDSALNFEMQAYEIQHAINDETSLPNTLAILGDINYQMKHTALALDYYRLSVSAAIKTKDQNQIADVYHSLALLYQNSGKTDSSIFYATKALDAAKTGGYESAIYTASNLLTTIYQGKNEHLELLYLKTAMAAKDSMFNAERTKQVQTLSFNETARQEEIMEEKHREAEERIVNLQLTGIAIFIPSFFLVLLVISKTRTHRKVVEFMGVLCLLLVFEFITFFIHPFVQHISNHLPVLELTILVIIAAILVPLHHKLTHWMREKLVYKKVVRKPKAADAEQVEPLAE